jgi:hypothetical protein
MDVGSTNFRFTLDDPEKKAETYRFPKTAELHLDSLDRYNTSTVPLLNNPAFTGGFASQTEAKLIGRIWGSSLTNSTDKCILQTKRNLMYGYMSRVALTQFNLNYNVPTVVTGYNDRFCFTSSFGSPQFTVTIPQGFYTPVTLARTMQTLMIAASGNAYLSLIITPPTQQNQTIVSNTIVQPGFTIRTNTATTLLFTFSGTGFENTVNESKFYRLIGMNRLGFGLTPEVVTNPVTTPAGTIPNAPQTTIVLGVPNFLPTDYVDIVSQALTNYKDTKDGNTSIQASSPIGRIWLSEAMTNGQTNGNGFPDNNLLGAAPVTFCKNWYNPNWSQWSPNQSINTIDITLLDMWGDPLFWSPTFPTEWSATLTVTE